MARAMCLSEYNPRIHLPLVGRSNFRSAQRGGSSGGGIGVHTTVLWASFEGG